ncbi:unnamed protein product [Urochloa humidicola]
MDMDHHSVLTKLGFGVLTCNSALAIYRSWGDAGSVAFVLAADAILVLLFLCLREFERARGGDGAARNDMGGPYSALSGVCVAVAAFIAALDARRDGTLSAAFVVMYFFGFLIMMGLFLRAFARAH